MSSKGRLSSAAWSSKRGAVVGVWTDWTDVRAWRGVGHHHELDERRQCVVRIEVRQSAAQFQKIGLNVTCANSSGVALFILR